MSGVDMEDRGWANVQWELNRRKDGVKVSATTFGESYLTFTAMVYYHPDSLSVSGRPDHKTRV